MKFLMVKIKIKTKKINLHEQDIKKKNLFIFAREGKDNLCQIRENRLTD